MDIVGELFRTRLQAPDLDPGAPLLNYGLDSVRSVELIVDLEHMFDVEIPDEDAATLLTLSDVVDWLERHRSDALSAR